MPRLLRQAARMIEVAPHDKLLLKSFRFDFERPLGEGETPAPVLDWLAARTPAPLAASPEIRSQVRALLRWGGFKASGRSKPASEYLEKALHEGGLPSINGAVDACNAVSLHSGLPISVVDLDLCRPPLRVGVVEEKIGYVFNPSGQVLDLKGLLCLSDADGPCASPVKDSQRTKTHPGSRRTLCLIWGSQEHPGQVEAALAFYRQILGLYPGNFPATAD